MSRESRLPPFAVGLRTYTRTCHLAEPIVPIECGRRSVQSSFPACNFHVDTGAVHKLGRWLAQGGRQLYRLLVPLRSSASRGGA
jgi:hypothetical protein